MLRRLAPALRRAGVDVEFGRDSPLEAKADDRQESQLTAPDSIDCRKRVEARVGIEPTHKGFADLSLTTWVPRLLPEQKPSTLSHSTGNCLGGSTSGDVGKVGQRSRRLRRQLFDHLHQLHEYSRESLGFLVNEMILTHTHWSIQSVHDRCIALAECVQTLHLPPARRSSIPTIDPV